MNANTTPEPTDDPKPRWWRVHGGVLVVYAILTLILTWPMAAHLTDSVPGMAGDAHMFTWNLWWTKHAIVDLHTNPLFTDAIFTPHGVGLVFHTHTLLNGLLSIPLQPLVGPAGALNILALLSFFLSAVGAYALALHVTGKRGPAFICGLIFAFCPYRFAHLMGHHNLLVTQWIPLYILFLLRMNSAERHGALLNGALAGLFLVFTILSSYYYAVYLALFTAGWLTLVLIQKPRAFPMRKLAIGSAAMAVVCVICLAPVVVLIAAQPKSMEQAGLEGAIGTDLFMADALGPVIPSEQHPILGDLARRATKHFKGNAAEWTVFVGYAVLALGLWALLSWRRMKAAQGWLVGFAGFLMLSWGDSLHILGKPVGLPLPYAALKHVPVLGNLRVPSRFMIMATLCLAVVAALALKHLLRKATPRVALLWTAALAVVIVFEFLAVSYPMVKLDRPPAYVAIGEDREPGVLLEIPLGWRDGLKPTIGKGDPAAQMWGQTIHGKKLFSGMVARFPLARVEAYNAMPLIRNVVLLQEGAPVPDLSTDAARAFAEKHALRYIVVRAPYFNHPVHAYLKRLLPLEQIHADEAMVAYRVKTGAE